MSSSSISLATVTPSLVTVGPPKIFKITTRRARCSSPLWQFLDATKHAFAGVDVVSNFFAAMVASFWHTVPWGQSEGTGGGSISTRITLGVDKDLAVPSLSKMPSSAARAGLGHTQSSQPSRTVEHLIRPGPTGRLQVGSLEWHESKWFADQSRVCHAMET